MFLVVMSKMPVARLGMAGVLHSVPLYMLPCSVRTAAG